MKKLVPRSSQRIHNDYLVMNTTSEMIIWYSVNIRIKVIHLSIYVCVNGSVSEVSVPFVVIVSVTLMPSGTL